MGVDDGSTVPVLFAVCSVVNVGGRGSITNQSLKSRNSTNLVL